LLRSGNYDVKPTVCLGDNGQAIVQYVGYTNGVPERKKEAIIHLTGVAVTKLDIKTVRISVIDKNSTNLYSDDQIFDKQVSPGEKFLWKYSFLIPDIVPKGKFTVNISFLDKDSAVYGCTQIV